MELPWNTSIPENYIHLCVAKAVCNNINHGFSIDNLTLIHGFLVSFLDTITEIEVFPFFY